MTNGNGLEGRVAVVTGGGRNIGRALSLGFARAGAIPVIADLNLDDAAAIVGEIEREGFRALAVHADVASADSVAAMIAAALAAFGRILSMMSDASFGWKGLVLLLVQMLLATLPLAHVFGFV